MSSTVRPIASEDLPAVLAIYQHHVLNGFGTFEETPPDLEEMGKRLASVASQNLPWLVVESAGSVTAFAYASQFRPRSAYRFTVEDSVYVAPEHTGRGQGTLALQSLARACAALGRREMLAVIGDRGNAASIALHAKCGFMHVGAFERVGLKFGRWVDIVLMQKTLASTDAR